MAWLRPAASSVSASLDAASDSFSPAVDEAVRTFTGRCLRASLLYYTGRSPTLAALVAAPSPTPADPPTLGQFAGWWSANAASLEPEVRAILLSAWRLNSSSLVSGPAASAATFYLRSVNDRLVRGLTPPLPEAAFDLVRASVATSLEEGWSTPALSQRLAAELGWETNGPYWRSELARYDASIDSILDPLGPPGAPAREVARLHDPAVARLQSARSVAVRRLDLERSYWQTRATTIARTESTGAYNYGAQVALVAEGVSCKQWLATLDNRTRPEHRAADGQVVRIDEPFVVGGFNLPQPGAPTGPPELTINCRCTMIGADCP